MEKNEFVLKILEVVKELLIGWAWPGIVLVVFFKLRKPMGTLLYALSERLKDLKSITIGQLSLALRDPNLSEESKNLITKSMVNLVNIRPNIKKTLDDLFKLNEAVRKLQEVVVAEKGFMVTTDREKVINLLRSLCYKLTFFNKYPQIVSKRLFLEEVLGILSGRPQDNDSLGLSRNALKKLDPDWKRKDSFAFIQLKDLKEDLVKLYNDWAHLDIN